MEKPLQTLHKSLLKNNYDVPDDYDLFEQTLTAKGDEGYQNRLTLWKSLRKNNFEVPDNYEDFSHTLFKPAGSSSKPASPAQPAQTLPEGFGQLDIQQANRRAIGKGPVSWEEPEQEDQTGESFKDDIARVGRGELNGRERKRVQDTMQQLQDEADYQEETGERLSSPVYNAPWETPTVARDDYGNIRHDDNGNIMRGFSTDEGRVEEHRQIERDSEMADIMTDEEKRELAQKHEQILEDAEYREPNFLESFYKPLGGALVKVGTGMLEWMDRLTSGMIVEDPSSPTGYIRTKEYDANDPINSGTKTAQEYADRLIREGQPRKGADFVELMLNGDLGGVLQKGVATAAESLPMTLSAYSWPTMVLNAISMAGNNYRDLTLENPDIPTWKRLSMAAGSAAIEQIIEKYSDPVFKYFGSGKLLKRAGKEAGENLANEITKEATETIAQRIYKRLAGLAKDAVGEGVEEIASNVGNDLLGETLDVLDGDKNYGIRAQWEKIKKENPNADLSDFAYQKAKEMMNSFFGGALAGAYTSGTAQLSAKGIQYALGNAVSEKQIENNPDKRLTPVTVDVAQSFDEGYTLEDDEKNPAAVSYRTYRQQLEELVSDEAMKEIDENPMAALGGMIESGSEEYLGRTWDDQQKQLFYDYITSKATYDGMLQGVRDDIDVKIKASDATIDMRTNPSDGMLHHAILNNDDEVYIISGSVVMDESGSNVDVEASRQATGGDNMILAVDQATGKIKPYDISEFSTVDQPTNAAQMKLEAADNIRKITAQQAADTIDGKLTFQPNDQYKVLDEQGIEHTIQVISDNGDGTVDIIRDGSSEPEPAGIREIQQMADAYNQAQILRHQAELQAQRKGQINGTENGQKYVENGPQNMYNEAQPSETQQETNGQNNGQNEDQQQSALDRIPVVSNEQGEPILNRKGEVTYLWHEAPVEDTTDALVEMTEGDMVMARDTAASMIENAKADLQKANKLKATGSDPLSIINSRKANAQAVQQAQAIVKYWQDVNTAIRKRMEAESAARLAEIEAAKSEEQRQREAEEARIRKEEQDKRDRERLREQIERDRERRTQPYQPIVDARKELAGDAESLAILDDTEPRSLEEWVSSLLSPHSMLWLDASDAEVGLQTELGLKRADMQRFMQLLGTKESGAKPFGKVVLDIYEALPEGMKNQYDSEDVRRVVLEMFQSMESSTQMMHLTELNRINEARQTAQENKRRDQEAEMEAWAEAYHLTPEERVTFEDFMSIEPPYTVEENIINQIIADNEQNRTSAKLDSPDVSGGDETGVEGGESQVQTAVEAADNGNPTEGTSQGAEAVTGEPPVVDDSLFGEPIIDVERSRKVVSDLAAAYASGDPAAIQQAADALKAYVDEGGEFEGYYQEEIDDYEGNDPQMLADQYKTHVLLDRYLDDDEDPEYIRTGLKPNMREPKKTEEPLGKTSSPEEIAAEEAKVDTNPTEAQKEAGNYQKGHINIDGYDVTIENPKGSVRSGVDGNGKAWEQEMHNTYGYIRGTEGVDGDHIDIFLSDNPTSGSVFVVDQINPTTGEFDEHKVMYGFASEDEAKEAYLSNYEKGWKGLGDITEVSREDFKKWVESSHRKTKPFAEYKSVKKEQPEKQHKRIVSDDEMEELRKQLLAKFNNLNSGIDVERMLLGAMYAVGKIERGVTKFADYAREMVEEIGDGIRPYLKAFYEAVRNMPEAAEYRDQMDSAEYVEKFDVDNFDKATAPDVFTKAEQVAKQQKAKRQVKKIEKEVKQKIQQGDLFAEQPKQKPVVKKEKPIAKVGDVFNDKLYFDSKGNVGAITVITDIDDSGDTRWYVYDLYQNEEKRKNGDKFVTAKIREQDLQAAIDTREWSRSKEKQAEPDTNEANANARYQLSETEKDAEGNTFFEKDGSIDLWTLPDLFAKAGRQSAPIRLTDRNLQHIIDEHQKELGNAEQIFDFLDDIFSNAKVLRRARSRSMFVVVENDKTDKAAIIRLMPSETGDYYNVETAGYYRKSKWKEYEDVIADLSEPDQSDAATDVSKPQTPDENGGETINAETQASSSEGKGTNNNPNNQEKNKKNNVQGLTQDKIEDVGEVIAGARKDLARKIAQSIDNATKQTLAELPFSKAYKKPDLKKAVEEGALRESDATFYDAWFSTFVDQNKPRPSQKEERNKKWIPGYKTSLEKWIDNTYQQLQVLKDFVEADEERRDQIIEELLSDKFPGREAELAEIEKRKEWNKGREGLDWGDKTTPNPLWVTYEVMKRLGYSPGDKLDIPYGILKSNTSGTGYILTNSKDERNYHVHPTTVEEGIDDIVWLAKLKRGDTDIQHPVSAFSTVPTKSEMGETGRYRVFYGSWRNPQKRDFDSKEEADEFAAKKPEATALPIQEVKRRFGYKVMFNNPLTNERMAVNDKEFDTKDEAHAYIDGNFEEVNTDLNNALASVRKDKAEKKELTPDDIVSVAMVRGNDGRYTYGVIIDKKYANNFGMPLIIREGFETRNEARKFADEVKGKIFEAYDNYKKRQKAFTYFDTGENSRLGEDYRGGKDVTAEEFMNTFGFRGVQFGNWTNQRDRQMAVNQAYDAFLDLAKLLGVSPKALSLNGELGIAFGARGVGGFAAHYEPGEIVINLTKTQGAGSLAHEWWHALDNYFARADGKRGDMVTDDKDISMRLPLREAFNRLIDQIRKSNYYKRSKEKGDYWGRMHEVTARLLAEWVDQELKKRGELNTFLSRGANTEGMMKINYERYEAHAEAAGKEVMPFEDYKALDEAMSGSPYPSASEVENFSDALRNIFDTVMERTDEDTGNVILYQKAEEGLGKNGQPDTPDAQETAMRDALIDLMRDAGIEVITDNAEAQRILDERNALVSMSKGKKRAMETASVTRDEKHQHAVISFADGAKVRNNLETLAKNQEKITGVTKLFRTKDGHAYGYTYNGKIYIDTGIATSETPIHEYTHLWAEAVRQKDPDTWKNIVEVLSSDPSVKPFWDKVARQYPELTDENDIAEEVLAQYSGKKGSEKLREVADEIARENKGVFGKAQAVVALRKMKDILTRFWKAVADVTGWRYTSAEEIADKVLHDLLSGVKPEAEGRANVMEQRDEADDTTEDDDEETADTAKSPSDIARKIYEDAVRDTGDRTMASALWYAVRNRKKGGWEEFKHKFSESWMDYTRSIKALQDAIEKASGEAIKGYEDVWRSLNAKSSIDNDEINRVTDKFIDPLFDHVAKMVNGRKIDGHDMDLDDVEVYLNAVHGIERNKRMAMKQAQAEYDNNTEMIRQQLDNPMLDTRERDSLKLKLLKAEARFNGIRNYMNIPAIAQWWNQWKQSVERQHNSGGMTDEQYAKAKERMEMEYQTGWKYKYRDRDYSGLTALFSGNFAEDEEVTEDMLEQAARDYAAKFEDIVGKDQADELWRLVKALNAVSLRKSYLSGLISKQQYDETMSMYEHYVPLRGWHDDYAGDVYQYISRGEAAEVLQNVLKKAYGRTSRAARIFGTMAAMANTAIVQGNKNKVAQKLMDLASRDKTGLLMLTEQYYMKDPDGNLIPLHPDLREDMTADEMQQEIIRFENAMKEREARNEVQVLKKKFKKEFPLKMAKWQEQRHAVRVMRNGKEYMVYVLGNPRAAEAFNGMLNPNSKPGSWINNLSRYMRFRAKWQTSLSPEFLVSNFQRDVMTASTGAYVKFGKDVQKRFMKNLANVMPFSVFKAIYKGKKIADNAGIFTLLRKYDSNTLDRNNETERLFDEFVRNGGMTGVSYITKSEEYQASMEEVVSRIRKGRLDKPRQVRKTVSDAVEFANKGIENATRFAMYMTSRQNGKTIADSIFDAKEASVNFNMKGSGAWGNMQARRLYLYVNPAMQALRMLGTWYENDPAVTTVEGGRIVTKEVTRRFMKAASMTLGASVATAMVNILLSAMFGHGGDGDDDDDKMPTDWWSLSEWNRYNYINVINPFGKGYLHWSIPQEMRPLWAIGQIGIDMAFGKITWQHGANSMLAQVNNLTPLSFVEGGTNDDGVVPSLIRSFTPTFIGDPLDAYLWNRDFMGHRITNQEYYNKEKPEWQRTGDNTPRWMIDASKKANEMLGGRYNERSFLEDWLNPLLNPSAIYHVITQQYGGIGSMAKRMASLYDQATDPEKDVEGRNIPFVPKFYVSTGDDYSENRLMNEKFWMYWSEFQDADNELTADRRSVKAGDMTQEEADKTIETRKNDGTYNVWKTIDGNGLDKVYNEFKGTSRQTEIQQMIVDAVENGTLPDYDQLRENAKDEDTRKIWEKAANKQLETSVSDVPDADIDKKFDEATGPSYRRTMGKRIANQVGASTDSYGKQSEREYDKIYQELRTAQDVREDAELLKLQEHAKKIGDDERAEEISKKRERIRDGIRDMKRGYDKANRKAMDIFRENRRKLLEQYGLR